MSVCPSVRWSVRPSVTLSFFGLLGATNAMYTAPSLVLFLFLLLHLLDPGLPLLSLQDGTPNLYNAVTDENATFTTRS